MAKAKAVKLIKKAKGAKPMKARAAKAGEPVDSFVFEYDEDVVGCTVYGIAQDGSQVDISGVATLTPPPSSSDETVCIIKDVSGMTFTMSGIKAGKATITATATWNDGSIGPFGFDLPVEVTSGPVGGIVVVPGTPVPKP